MLADGSFDMWFGYLTEAIGEHRNRGVRPVGAGDRGRRALTTVGFSAPSIYALQPCGDDMVLTVAANVTSTVRPPPRT